MAQLTGRAQRIAYQMLDFSERQEIWSKKLTFHINSESFSPDQLAVVQKFKDAIDNGLLHMDLTDVKKFENDWLVDAKKYFSKATIGKIAYSINYSMNSIVVPDNEDPDCACNIGAFFTCGTIDPLYLCEQAKCKQSPIGCGFSFLYTCDGMCKREE